MSLHKINRTLSNFLFILVLFNFFYLQCRCLASTPEQESAPMASEDEMFLDMVMIPDNEMDLIIGNFEPIETSSGVTLIYFPETNKIYNPETGQSFNLSTTNVT